jgi:hypothetical protein
MTLAINLCHGFSVIASVFGTGENLLLGDIDTGDKYIAGDNNTSEQLSLVSWTLVINLSPATMIPEVCTFC